MPHLKKNNNNNKNMANEVELEKLIQAANKQNMLSTNQLP